MKFPLPHRHKPRWLNAATPAELLANTTAAPRPAKYATADIAAIVTDILEIPDDGMCNFAVIGLTHPGHKFVLLAPGDAAQVHKFLQKAADSYKKGAL